MEQLCFHVTCGNRKKLVKPPDRYSLEQSVRDEFHLDPTKPLIIQYYDADWNDWIDVEIETLRNHSKLLAVFADHNDIAMCTYGLSRRLGTREEMDEDQRNDEIVASRLAIDKDSATGNGPKTDQVPLSAFPKSLLDRLWRRETLNRNDKNQLLNILQEEMLTKDDSCLIPNHYDAVVTTLLKEFPYLCGSLSLTEAKELWKHKIAERWKHHQQVVDSKILSPSINKSKKENVDVADGMLPTDIDRIYVARPSTTERVGPSRRHSSGKAVQNDCIPGAAQQMVISCDPMDWNPWADGSSRSQGESEDDSTHYNSELTDQEAEVNRSPVSMPEMKKEEDSDASSDCENSRMKSSNELNRVDEPHSTSYRSLGGGWKSPYQLPLLTFKKDLLDKLWKKEPLSKTDKQQLTNILYEDITGNMKVYYPTPTQYEEVAAALLSEFPCLAGSLTHAEAKKMWKHTISGKFRNCRRRIDSDVPVVHVRKRKKDDRGNPEEFSGLYYPLTYYNIQGKMLDFPGWSRRSSADGVASDVTDGHPAEPVQVAEEEDVHP